MRILFGILVILFLSQPSPVPAEDFYSMSPSTLGSGYKKFTHNLFGFEVDIPNGWQFGVHVQEDMPVIILYPDGVDTSKFHDDFEMIEIGILPFANITLEQAHDAVVTGLQSQYSNFIAEPHNIFCEGKKNCYLEFSHQWQSKSGYTVYEYVRLIDAGGHIRSLASRGIEDATSIDHKTIMDTFKVLPDLEGGQDVDVIKRNPDMVQQAQQGNTLDQLDIDAVLNGAPEAIEWIKNSGNAALVSDDFSLLGRIKHYISTKPIHTAIILISVCVFLFSLVKFYSYIKTHTLALYCHRHFRIGVSVFFVWIVVVYVTDGLTMDHFPHFEYYDTEKIMALWAYPPIIIFCAYCLYRWIKKVDK